MEGARRGLRAREIGRAEPARLGTLALLPDEEDCGPRGRQTQAVSVTQGSDRGLDRQPVRDEFAPVERLQNATAGGTAKLGLFATDRVELHSAESGSTFRAHHIAFSHVELLRVALR